MDEPEFLATWETLSPRQTAVMRLVADGKGNDEIAGELDIAAATVELHRRYAMNKFAKRNGNERINVSSFIALWWRFIGSKEQQVERRRSKKR